MTLKMDVIRLAAIAALVFLAAPQALAVCNDTKNWLQSPYENVKVLPGYKSVDLDVFGSSSTNGTPAEKPYPPPLPADAKGQPVDPNDISYEVPYFEPDGKGQWRICRIETWLRGTESATPLPRGMQMPNRQPAVAELRTTHRLTAFEAFLFDSKGRIQERVWVGTSVEGGRRSSPSCFRYAEADYVSLWVRAHTTNRCPEGEPDIRDDWNRFRYVKAKGDIWTSWAERHIGSDDGRWAKRIFFRERPEASATSGKAGVDSKRGVFEILGGNRLGLLDKSLGPSMRFTDGSEKSIEYFFPVAPVPISMLEDVEHRMYDYPRRRETSATSGVKLVEYFPPRQHEIRERFFTAIDGRTVRQEINDTGGKVKRVINVALVGIGKDKGGFYEEDLGGQIGLRLKGKELIYRVWEYDAAGKGKLVAVGWNKRIGSAFVGKQTLDETDIAFGTPDGKVKWKSKEEFFKAFDFDEYASRAYP